MKSIRSGIARGAALAAGLAFLSVPALANEFVKYEVTDGEIAKSLTGQAGDPEAGKAAMINRRGGNCLACHEVSALSDQPFHGEVGPSLDGAGSRWSEGELRLIVANSKAVFEDTIMPAFHRTEGLNRVAEKFQGKTILSAQEVEDVVAYLMTLKDE
ncbi:sulfur oxidation c-type cytochrome SoxX [Tepidamorphus sp. 3E244]|uniref:sulfur oxidation c-type cytochrome SoxX n=1 Tax=Tepidamorphus sp. 3E244 TaxID=3385498 RepID=UPI0038FD0299